jgi:hypothetical protein
MRSAIDQTRNFVLQLERVFTRKTVRGFAEQVNSVRDLEYPLQKALYPCFEGDDSSKIDSIRLIIKAPAQSILRDQTRQRWWLRGLLAWEVTPQRVVVLTEDRIVMITSPYQAEEEVGLGKNIKDDLTRAEYASEWENLTREPDVQVTFLRDICSIETGSILLSSWFEWTYLSEGYPKRNRIYYNTVSRDLFERFGELIRQYILTMHGLELSVGKTDLASLEGLPFKFKRMIPAHLLLPGEKIRTAAYCPSIWKKDLGIFHRQISPRQVVVITDCHLILVQEEPSIGEDGYGLIAQFFPITYVEQLDLNQKAEGSELVLILSHPQYSLLVRRPFLDDYWSKELQIKK